MYGLTTIMQINAARAGAEAKAKRDLAPPPVPRAQRKLAWFSDRALVKLAAEIQGGSVADLLAAVEREIDYRKREDRIIKAINK
jgi:hypothetical protein